MNIIVCIKQVPSSNQVRLHPVTHTIMRDAKESVINPFDAHAIEQAVMLREQCGGKVTAISMGIPDTEQLLRDAIARGADEGVLLSDRRFAGADTLATSYTLSMGIAGKIPYDLILCGKMAVDGDTAQIGPELAEQLHIPHVTDVCCMIKASEKELIVKKKCDHGYQIIRVMLPALLTVTREINLPRLPSIAGIKASCEKEIPVVNADMLDLDQSRIGLNGSPTQVMNTYAPSREKTIVYLEGTLEEQAAFLLHQAEEVH